ncbi:POLS2 protein, partial [Rostratula benghalensis]|nr:POLS2 protein [Rostratula benghalensis]
ERAVAEVVIHEGYQRVEGGHDLALVRLETPVALGPRVGTICLPRPRHPFAFGTPCWVTGWGNVAENGGGPGGMGHWGLCWGVLGLHGEVLDHWGL